MKPSLSLWELLGWIAVVATLALASPGVKTVRAETDGQVALELPPPGPSCPVDAEAPRPARRVLSVDLSRLVAMQPPAASGGVVALDTGGYGYAEEPASGARGTSLEIVVVPEN